MALIIESTKTKKLNISGTSIDVKKVYVRTEFSFSPCGKKVNAGLYIYETKQAFKDNKNILQIDGLHSSGYNFNVKEQTVQLASDELAKQLKKQGYKVTVEL